jgi:hypothetical protein
LFTPGEARISERGPLVQLMTGFATPQPVLHAVICELLLGGAWRTMLIPKRYGYFVFGFIQSGFTCAVAAGIASMPFLGGGMFISQWLWSWLIAWIIMTPFVLVAAPFINRAVAALTRGYE